MLLKQMKYFITIVDCHSFTEAAEQCFISQSAISQQIKALEKELGIRLFERNKRQFSLDRKSTRLNSSHNVASRMPSSA